MQVENESSKSLEWVQVVVERLVEGILTSEQKRNDFKSQGEDEAIDATHACHRVVALIAAVRKSIPHGLEGQNEAVFKATLVSRLAAKLEAHVHRHSYTMAGGLRLKNDLSEYLNVLNQFGHGNKELSRLRAVIEAANLLVVPAASVHGMLEEELALGFRDASRIAQLRTDFSSSMLPHKAI